MTAGPDVDRATARMRATLEGQALLHTLGVEIVELSPGRVVLDLPVKPAVTQQNGFVHAGAIATIADSAAGVAALSLMAEDRDVLSVEFKLNLLSPGIGDRLRATATVIRSGRTITVVSAEVRSITSGAPDKPVALLQGTMIAVDAAR